MMSSWKVIRPAQSVKKSNGAVVLPVVAKKILAIKRVVAATVNKLDLKKILERVELRAAMKRDLINRKMLALDLGKVIEEMTTMIQDLYPRCHTGLDAECEVLEYMYGDKRFLEVGATKYDIVIWWNKLKIKNYENSYMRSKSRSV